MYIHIYIIYPYISHDIPIVSRAIFASTVPSPAPWTGDLLKEVIGHQQDIQAMPNIEALRGKMQQDV